MNTSNDRLNEALHELAASSPQASPELGTNLAGAFARHHRRRRQKRAAFALGVAACLAVAFGLLRPGITTHRPDAAHVSAPSIQAPPSVANADLPHNTADSVAPRQPVSPPRVAQAKRKPKPPRANRTATADPTVANADFIALPNYDPRVPVGASRMVRLELSGPALQLIGYPVDGQLLHRQVLTDVLVGQDGLPYAVRLLQTSNAR